MAILMKEPKQKIGNKKSLNIENARIVRKRMRKRRILPGHVFREVQAYKHIKKCKSCSKRFEDKYKARLYCDDCKK